MRLTPIPIQVDFRREMRPIAFVDPGAFPVTNPARSPRRGLLRNFASRRPKRTEAIQCPPSHTFRVARDSGKIQLLRDLAGYRQFSAHSKAILSQVTD